MVDNSSRIGGRRPRRAMILRGRHRRGEPKELERRREALGVGGVMGFFEG